MTCHCYMVIGEGKVQQLGFKRYVKANIYRYEGNAYELKIPEDTKQTVCFLVDEKQTYVNQLCVYIKSWTVLKRS